MTWPYAFLGAVFFICLLIFLIYVIKHAND